MRIPKFTPSKHFFEDDPGEENFPCLLAKVKNSKLAGLASQYIARSRRDPECTIRLRGPNPTRVSAWLRKMLERLFSGKGLSFGVGAAMKDYETDPDWGWEPYICVDESERKMLARSGITAFAYVKQIIIDEIQKEVIIEFSTNLDGNIMEHGAVAHLRNGRWRFGQGDYLGVYSHRLYKERPELRNAFTERIAKERVEALVADREYFRNALASFEKAARKMRKRK